MKRLTVLLLSILLCATAAAARLFCVAAQPVYAASPAYARAAVRNAYFFTEKNTSTSVFAVPYTYCVEVLRDDGDWYYVRYAGDTGIYKALYGYCRKEDFTPEEGTPQVTFLYKTVKVSYSAGGGSSSLPVLGEIEVEAAYYGTYYSGATVYSYVYCQGSFGYIEGANDDYPLNLPDKNEEGGKDGETEKKGGLGFAAIAFIVIALLFAAVIVIIYFTTRKPKMDD